MGRASMSMAFLLAALLLAPLTASMESLTALPGCQESCGGVDIPYPFGIGKDCFRKGFEIDCADNGSGGRMPVPATTSEAIQVLKLSVAPVPEAQVMLPVAWQCFNSTFDLNGSFDGTVNINPDGVYRISNTRNQLVVLGCNVFTYIKSGHSGGGRYPYEFYAGCAAYCNDSRSAQDGACAGVGCCHVDFPPGLTDNVVSFSSGGAWAHIKGQEFSPCDYAFIVDKDNYTFRAADLHMDVKRTMPLRLDWAIRDSNGSSMSMSCTEAAKSKTQYACVSDHSECVDSTNGPGYICNCTEGYEGNPYLRQGCTNIDECGRSTEYPCFGVCRDTQGSYECSCRPGYQSNDPKTELCTPKFPRAAQISLGTSLGVFSLVVAVLVALIMIQKRRLKEYFEKNGGDKLKNVNGLIIFTKKELKKITNNNSEFIGKGSFGEVYKGTLSDNTIVAVKSSIEVTIDTLKEFTKEVEIQTKMIHPNILKLLGCCLEVDVPMLVYEFAANGSLHGIIQGNNKEKLPLNLRMDIAIGAAEGLKYMHSCAHQGIPIRHGDVKPDNILLDDKLRPKISDFGLAKVLKGEYTAKFVVGCNGYIDPAFMNTGVLTQKSDIYSFGAVLLELITRKKIVYGEDSSLVLEFRSIYEKEKSGRAMFDKEIEAEEDILVLEEIGKLALECLKDVKDRPDMTEVVEQLVMLRRDNRKFAKEKNTSPHHILDTGISMEDSPNN